MNIQEIYEFGLAQGWDPDDARMLAAIAWAESKGDTNSVHDEPDGSTSYGIWQINSVHIQNLIDAGIITSVADLADPTVNAKAAYYVGHRTDYSEPWDDWDWTRWSVNQLPPDDDNSPLQFIDQIPVVDVNDPETYPDDWWPSAEEVPEVATGGDIDYRQILKEWFPHLADLSDEEFEPIYQQVAESLETGGADTLALLETARDNLAAADEPAADVGQPFGPWDPEEWLPTPEFDEAVRADPEWDKRVQEWGFGEEQQDWLMSYLYYRFAAGWGPDEANVDAGRANWTPGGTVQDFLGGVPPDVDLDDPETYPDDWYPSDAADLFVYDEVRTVFDSKLFKPGAVGDDYIPTGSDMPSGWFTLWAEDNTTVGDWLDSWVDRFNTNAEATGGPGDPQYSIEDLQDDFYNHATDGLYNQDWWTAKTNNFTSMMRMWYAGGGPGTPIGGDQTLPGDEGADWTDYAGTGNWGKIWLDSIEVIRAVAENLGITDVLSDALVSEIAFRLMAEGGAAAHLEPSTAQNWATQAQQTVQEILLGKLERGEFEKPLGVGTVQELETKFTNQAANQLITLMPGEARAWAIGVKGEQGLNEAQVLATIDQRAYAEWGLTAEQQEEMGAALARTGGTGTTIGDMVNPLWLGATGVWDDDSYRKDDEWLMDNYQVEEDGIKRFRTKQEMRNLARTNLDRFQHSTQYQNPLNDFIGSAAAMFRSDY